MINCVPTCRKAYFLRMSTHPSESTRGMYRSISLFVFPFFACSMSSYLSELSELTQLAAEGYRLPKRVKIPYLRVPLAMLAVITDMSVVVCYFLCHIINLLYRSIYLHMRDTLYEHLLFPQRYSSYLPRLSQDLLSGTHCNLLWLCSQDYLLLLELYHN